jgi:hypothetical protein
VKSPIFRADFGNSTAKKIIVSAGGGVVGEKLLRTAIEAHKILSKSENIESKIITGLFLPKENYLQLRKEAKEIKGLQICRFVQNLRGEMANSDVSISQCGYNTAFDILLSGVSAIVVPYSEYKENEQKTRAEKLEKIGALRVLDSNQLNPKILAEQIKESFSFRMSEISLDIGGGENSARIIESLLPNKLAKVIAEKSWLAPVHESLSVHETEVRIFFRNDDAGIANKRLYSLLNIFEKYSIPIDLAAIPTEFTNGSTEDLKSRICNSNGLFSIHQHGFSHANHETTGRKYEFGCSRSKAEQLADISEGKKILQTAFGEIVQPIFTPPWNRCTNATTEVLRELNFQILSRELNAETLELNQLKEIPVSIDWFAKRKGIYLTKSQIGAMIAEKIAVGTAFGIMLHHAEMDELEREYFEQLCCVFADFKQVKFCSIFEVFEESQPKATALLV